MTNIRMWRKGAPLHCWWECNLVHQLWKTVWRFLKKLKVELSYDIAIPPLGVYLKSTKISIQKDTGTPMFTEAMFTVAKTWKHPKCPPTDKWIKRLNITYTMTFYSSINRNEIPSFAAVWIDLENIMLSET